MILIFLVGLQLGALVGAILRSGMRAPRSQPTSAPKLTRIQAQLDNLESALNPALLSRYAELGDRAPAAVPLP
jgi:uncharacterized membrane-anchored protein YhcB (DUF1043 family)